MNEIPRKLELRRRMRAIRDAIPGPQRDAWSRDIAAQVLGLPEVMAAAGVFSYVGTGTEVATRGLLANLLAMGKNVAVPRVLGVGRMEPARLRSVDDLIIGAFGLPEAPPDAVPLHDVDLVIVPGVAFTPSGHRLGMGGGFYDRWLGTHRGVESIGLCFPPQLVDQLPVELHDVPVSRVCCP